MLKIFAPSTTLDNVNGRDLVRVDYFCTDRKQPIGPYKELIENYDKLDERQKKHAETCLDQFLNESELGQLKEHLKDEGIELRENEATSPVLSRHIYCCEQMCDGSLNTVLTINDPKIANSTVTIKQLVQWEYRPQTTQTPEEYSTNGGVFVSLLLSKLGISCGAHVEDILRTIYAETGLFVECGDTTVLERLPHGDSWVISQRFPPFIVNTMRFVNCLLGALGTIDYGSIQDAADAIYEETRLYVELGFTAAEREQIKKEWTGYNSYLSKQLWRTHGIQTGAVPQRTQGDEAQENPT